MTQPTRLPIAPAAFALLAAAVMLAYSVPVAVVLVTSVLWGGALWLATSRPPESRAAPPPAALDEAQMSDLFELSETPVIVTKHDRVTVANAAARRLLGAHILGQDVRVALRHPRAVALIDSGDSDGTTISGLVRRRDEWRVNRKLLPGAVAVYELINRTAEADISRAHTDFVANASHELRTPLAAIIGYVETLREEGPALDPATSERFLSTIQREAKRLQSLVEDLMSLSRIEAEKHEAPSQRVDLSALVERAARDAAGADHAGRLDLAVSPGVIVQGDEQQLEQVVRNLVDNALKYAGTAEPVAISLAEAEPGRVALTVADRGEGIAAEHLPLLTRRFYRTDPGRSRASGGTGLGLAIVKHVVERHRGKLDIASAAGVGTTVTVRLARARPE